MRDRFPTVEQLKQMNLREKEALAEEIRAFLLKSVSATGGHLASNLGIVELTIALHTVFDAPKDKMIWDVGHQSYVHKLLTGRGDGFSRLRMTDGMSGFPKRSESVYDHFDTGHSTTSISAAVGFAVAEKTRAAEAGEVPRQIVAIIGDGAMTGGMAYEALNHLGSLGANAKIILNDNEMSISPNVGGFVRSLRTSTRYNRLKAGTKTIIGKLPLIGRPTVRLISRLKRGIRTMLMGKGQLFDEMGIKFIGHVDGHQLRDLEKALQKLKRYDGPALLHVHTVKGKGYPLAEQDPTTYHGVGVFNPEIGIRASAQISQEEAPELKSYQSFSEAFGDYLVHLAKQDAKIVAVSAAMIPGTGLTAFSDMFPNRIYDVGIAEQHAVTFSAALAMGGVKPFVAIYSTFLQRAYDQLVHDVALQQAPVVFCMDRAGIVGADGETHHGIYDLAYLSSIPGIRIQSVSTYAGLRRAMDEALVCNSPVAIRYPRGGERKMSSSVLTEEKCGDALFVLPDGRKMVVVATARAVELAAAVSEGYYDSKLPVLDLVHVAPLEPHVQRYLEKMDVVVTVEDHLLQGGLGSVLRSVLPAGIQVISCGFEEVPTHGNSKDLFERYGLGSGQIYQTICQKLKEFKR